MYSGTHKPHFYLIIDMKHNVSEYEKKEMEKIKLKKAGEEGVIHQTATKAHDEDDDDSDWDWYISGF